MQARTIALGISLLLLMPCAFGKDDAGLSFEHADWAIACDNTRTCRVAGYQSDGDEASVSVLLTRMAGSGQQVKGELTVGIDDDNAVNHLPKRLVLAMTVDGKKIGTVTINSKTMQASLSDEQVKALLASLVRNRSDIVWTDGNYIWKLSDKGAAAVLLKMDEFQGRIGTRGALIRKGSRGDDSVLPTLPKPVVMAANVIDPEMSDKGLATGAAAQLRELLPKATGDDGCDPPTDNGENAKVMVARLNEHKMLASMICWRAAYNAGSGYWVVNNSPPWDPVLVTIDGTDYQEGEIGSDEKGRGIGDCMSSDAWVWDGNQFMHVQSSTSGLCRGIPGGAWTLPTIVTDVRKK